MVENQRREEKENALVEKSDGPLSHSLRSSQDGLFLVSVVTDEGRVGHDTFDIACR